MKAVSVTYTVKTSFVKKNIANIQAFLDDVKEKGSRDTRYQVFVGEDGKTFTHLSVYYTAEAQEELLSMPSFLDFQEQRDASGLEAAPQVTLLNLLLSSHIIF